jgi:hypothetical protein
MLCSSWSCTVLRLRQPCHHSLHCVEHRSCIQKVHVVLVMSLQRHQRYVMVDLDHEEDEEATRGLVGAQTSGGGHGESGTHGGGVVAGCPMAHSYLWFCGVRLVCS